MAAEVGYIPEGYEEPVILSTALAQIFHLNSEMSFSRRSCQEASLTVWPLHRNGENLGSIYIRNIWWSEKNKSDAHS